MSTHSGVGQSTLEDARAAGFSAATSACSQLPDSTADLLIVFATAAYDQPTLLSGIREAAPDAQLVGCSGEGVIADNDSHEVDCAVVVMAMASDSIRAQTYLIEGYAEDPSGCAETLAARIGHEPAMGIIVFPDGLVGDCTSFLDRLNSALPGVPVVGGTSADDMQFSRTYQYGGDQVASGAVAAVVLRGAGRLEVAVSHGCLPIGTARRISQAGGGWVQEIDGRHAWSVFKEYLDGDPEDLNADGIVHLCVGTPIENGTAAKTMVIRTPMQLDRESGALFFPGGGLATGQSIHMTRRDTEQIRRSAEECARSLRQESGQAKPVMVLQFDCAGRGKIMFGGCAAGEIVEPLHAEMGSSIPWAGFHTYGEIAPIAGHPLYHNYTVALCALYDAA
ncbi:MAG: FIST C-terminal domain-containing protein [Candidatus Eisenbacteria bacterium]|nr:FIST C-terminal domain-containing protein [Candidatus Eisenbacteria bacterium]MCC7144704.1 FIST C-terminal domain-containing protein [Candidatus Eisenbacteria bacterium]